MNGTNESEEKRVFLFSMILASMGLFVYKKHVVLNPSRHVSMRHRLKVDELIGKYFIYSATSSPNQSQISRIGYAFNHASWLHLGANMTLLYLFGRDFVDNEKVTCRQFMMTSMVSSVAASLAHRNSRPMIGSSGIVMGLLGGLAVLVPAKTWLLILPVPGVPVTNMQLAQAVVASHFVALLSDSRFASKYAMMAHLGGLVAGSAATALVQSEKVEFANGVRESLGQWKRSFSCAALVLYWFWLSAQIPLAANVEEGELRTKRRFIERSLDDQY